MNSTLGSVTQMSTSAMSWIVEVVRSSRPQQIDPCCAISSAAKVTPATIPRYLARSPVNIFSAIQFMVTPSTKHGRRFQAQHAAQADQRRRDDDQARGRGGEHGYLPRHVHRRRNALDARQEYLLGNRRQPETDRVAKHAHHQSLYHHHADDAPITHAHRLECAELLEVVEREQVERLPRD